MNSESIETGLTSPAMHATPVTDHKLSFKMTFKSNMCVQTDYLLIFQVCIENIWY